jgi:hypothetical protein
MSCRETLERLDDLVDGRLATAERRQVEAHLRGCLGCSSELAALRGLLGQAAQLPGVPPRRDLWPAIRERIAPATATGERRSRAAARLHYLWWLAAAAALMAAVLLPGRDRRTPPDAATGVAPAALTRLPGTAQERPPSDAVEPSPRALLAATLEARRSELPTESVIAFENDLQVLDRAIEEIEGRLRLLLAERRQQEAELLKLLVRA